MRSLRLLAIALAWVILPVRDAPASIDPYSFSSVEDVEGLVEAPAAFEQWLDELLQEARSRGFSDELLSRTLAGVRPLRRVVESDRSQAELITTFEQYYSRRVTPEVISRGQQHLRDHGPLLARIQDTYGVQPRFIVALWGIESRFGTTHGSTPVFQALATLAWEARRAAFFRAQLYDALTMVASGYIDVPSMSGSWAGAMGQPQFMPSSYLRYAVDFDGDGRRDIWTSHADALASIANYLKHHGWRGDQTWGRPVRVTPAAAKRIVVDLGARDSGCRAIRGMIGPAPLTHWQRLGVRRADGGDLHERGGANDDRHPPLPALRQLRRSAELQLCAQLRAHRRAPGRQDRRGRRRAAGCPIAPGASRAGWPAGRGRSRPALLTALALCH